MTPRPILKQTSAPAAYSYSQSQSHAATAANTLNNSYYHPHPHPSSPGAAPYPYPYPAQHQHQYQQHQQRPHTPHQQHQHHQHPRAAVHFPPSPALTRTFACHSAAAYDRSPIVVAPNSCALPERGCPGRTYLLADADIDADADAEYGPPAMSRTKNPAGRLAYARDYHPRALAFASASSSSGPPPLVHDLSSESDESDGVSGLPAQLASSFPLFAPPSPSSTSFSTSPYYSSSPSYPPSSTKHHDPALDLSLSLGAMSLTHDDDDAHPTYPAAYGSPERAAHRRHRRHERSRDPDLIPGPPAASVESYSYSQSSSHSQTQSSSPSPRKKGVRRTHRAGLVPPPAGGFGMMEEGCLGGF